MDASSGPRWLLPAEDGLLLAVGRAVYGFAQLERSVERVRQALPAMLGGQLAGLSPEEMAAELEAARAAGPPDAGLPTEFARVLRRYCGLRAWRDGLLGLPGQGSDALCRGGHSDEPPAVWRAEAVSRMARDIEITAAEANRLLRKHF